MNKTEYMREWARRKKATDPAWAARLREYQKRYRTDPKNIPTINAQKAAYKRRNPEKRREYQARYYAERKEVISFKMRERKYGVAREDFARMLEAQSGACPICSKPLPAQTSHIAVDHCHKTGAVRGLLHRGCNVAVGMYELHNKRLAAYLKRNGEN